MYILKKNDLTELIRQWQKEGYEVIAPVRQTGNEVLFLTLKEGEEPPKVEGRIPNLPAMDDSQVPRQNPKEKRITSLPVNEKIPKGD